MLFTWTSTVVNQELQIRILLAIAGLTSNLSV